MSVALMGVRSGWGNSGVTTVLLRFRRKLAMLPKSLKMRASTGMSVHMFCTTVCTLEAILRFVRGCFYKIKKQTPTVRLNLLLAL